MNKCIRCQTRNTRTDLCYMCRGILKRNPAAEIRPYQIGISSMTEEERFWSKVDKNGPQVEGVEGNCWIWLAHLDKDGYGRFVYDGSDRMAHRWSFRQENDLNDDLTLDHLCRTRNCVRPSHLEQVTTQENILRGEGLPAQNAKKEFCSRGHEFTPENTGKQSKGRYCIACKRITDQKAYAKRRGAIK